MPSNRVQVGARVDRDTYERFKAFTEEHKGQVRGELGRMLDNAMQEYMNNDRSARIERKLDRVIETLPEESTTHTHTANESKAKVEEIVDNLRAKDKVVIPDDTVERVIEDVAGFDNRTIKKYKGQLKRQGLAYQHPSGNVWTLEQSQWVEWADNWLDNDPSVDVNGLTDPYPMSIVEFDKLVGKVEQ